MSLEHERFWCFSRTLRTDKRQSLAVLADKYRGVYERARELGFPNLSMHSGEEGPADWVRYSVEKLGLKRIDHGVRSVDDPAVVKMLAERNIFVTVRSGDPVAQIYDR